MSRVYNLIDLFPALSLSLASLETGKDGSENCGGGEAVAKLRSSLGLTQMEFAAKFCISLGTLRHWERGDRKPHGPALALLHVVAKEPQAVLRALS